MHSMKLERLRGVDPRTAVHVYSHQLYRPSNHFVLLPTLRIALHLTSAHYGMIMTGFMLAYMIGQVPGASCLIGSGYAPGLPSRRALVNSSTPSKGLPGARLVSESFAHFMGLAEAQLALRGKDGCIVVSAKAACSGNGLFSTAAQQWGECSPR